MKKIQTNEWKVGKVQRSARCDQEECMKLEPDAMLAEAGKENELIKCFDDITGKELLWQAVKENAKKKLKYLRELDVYERLMSEQLWQSTTSLQSTQGGSTLTKHGSTLTKHLRGSQCKADHELVPASSKVETGPLEALKAIMSIAASHSPEFSLMHVDVSRAKLPAEVCSGMDVGKLGLLKKKKKKKKMNGTRDAASYHSAENQFERFRSFLELINRFESNFVVAEIIFF